MDKLIALPDLAAWLGVHKTNASRYVTALEKAMNRKFWVQGRVGSHPVIAVTEEDAVDILRIREREGFTVRKRPAVMRKVARSEAVR